MKRFLVGSMAVVGATVSRLGQPAFFAAALFVGLLTGYGRSAHAELPALGVDIAADIALLVGAIAALGAAAILGGFSLHGLKRGARWVFSFLK